MLLQWARARNPHQTQFTITAAEMMGVFASALVVSCLPVVGNQVEDDVGVKNSLISGIEINNSLIYSRSHVVRDLPPLAPKKTNNREQT
jgi:hypothetical protein